MGAIRYNPFFPSLNPRRPNRESPRYQRYLAILDYMQDLDITPSTYIRHHFGSPAAIQQLINEMQQLHFIIIIPTGYAHSNARYRTRPYGRAIHDAAATEAVMSQASRFYDESE